MKRLSFIPTKDYLCNYVINQIPFHSLRVNHYRRLGVKIGAGSTIFMSTYMHEATSITIGEGTIINQHCHLDGRGGLKIGSNVNISSHVVLVAGSHEVNDGEHFGGYAKAITVEDYAWLCTRATILAGVTVGRGAVVAAGAVVTKSVEPYAIVAGIPARKIGERNQDLHYNMANCGHSWH
jgi:acetyltransferase-like isoleucine patch superfamily enzyme